ncbi:MAG: OsmC family protein [Rhizobiales bacterium]|nr:bifunctional alpha/beta hydrolase/OsmC family protein [Hyphomicrobiales bacterium]NRB13983.1 OsmC family protein [Hyphomicrobiales bacterium]
MQKLTFTNRHGHKLAATLHPSKKPSQAYAVFAHCFTCGQNSNAAANIAKQLAAKGIHILRFDFTGIGASQGAVEQAYFSSNVQDMVDAANFLAENYQAPSLLIGHSLGGTAVLAAALQLPNVKAVATIGAPSDSGHILKTLGTDAQSVAAKGTHIIKFYGNDITLSQTFIDDLCVDHLTDRLAKLKKALLIMHSPIDEIVSVDNAGTLFQMAHHPKSFVSLNKADHLLSKKSDAIYAASIIYDWAYAYINTDTGAKFPTAKSGQVAAALRMQDTYLTRINMAGHQILGDEPKNVGGTDMGAGPFQLLEAALASCTTITLSMYITRKQWDVTDINCVVTTSKINGRRAFERQISVKGNLTDAQRERILDIANKCPIHKTLSHGSVVNSYLV